MQLVPSKCCVFCNTDDDGSRSTVFKEGPTIVMVNGRSANFYRVTPILAAKREAPIIAEVNEEEDKILTKKPALSTKRKRKRANSHVAVSCFLPKRISKRIAKQGVKAESFAQEHQQYY